MLENNLDITNSLNTNENNSEDNEVKKYDFNKEESLKRIVLTLSNELNLKEDIVSKIINLLDEGNTVPFIARYRKEVTNNTDDVTLRNFEERLKYLRNIEERKETILNAIYLKDKLTKELENEIKSTFVLSTLEDLYRPYKEKRVSKAKKAIEKGLEPIKAVILKNRYVDDFYNSYLESFVNEEKGVKSKEEALEGAKDIIKEEFSDDPKFRKYIKESIYNYGLIEVKLKESKDNTLTNVKSKYDTYKDFENKINKLKPYQILAIFRGNKEKELSFSFSYDKDRLISYMSYHYIKTNNIYFEDIISECIKDSLNKSILPSITNEIENDLFTFAEDRSIEVFKKNLKELLLYPPLKNKKVLGFDPGFRTGCKYAYVDTLSIPHEVGTVYITSGSKEQVEKGKKEIATLIKKYDIDYIALGNGTASRESEEVLNVMLKEYNLNSTKIFIVNESGASVYSASKLGEEEFPELSVEKRSAISLARRIIDPLAELVKIEPKAIGVGQYQHDMNQTKLNDALSNVVEDCVNKVGVRVNNASISLLNYVSGVSKTLAKNIYEYRKENGDFKSRNDLKKVKMMGEKAFTQCAGFLKVEDSEEILDNTMIHPERYNDAKLILKEVNCDLKNDSYEERVSKLNSLNKTKFLNEHKDMILETLEDILSELKNPGRDIRDEMEIVTLDNKVKDIKDLKVGMVLNGTIRNIMDFGMFIDINVHQDGLVHISEASDSYIKNLSDIFSISQVVKVKVISLDLDRKRIGLSIKQAK